MISILTSSAYAVEVDTECPEMRESNSRTNPKANLAQQVKKPQTKGRPTGSVQ
jgi:hypothetical protein